MERKFIVERINKREEINDASNFFSSKWGVPIEAYIESMEASLTTSSGVPSWFVVRSNNCIIGGIGIIENDFHKRKDLRPNLCAFYVKEEYQGHGIGRMLINHACAYLKEKSISEVYLITTHTKLYEKLNFLYYDDIEEDSGDKVRCYFRKL